ncbi:MULTISPECIES: hypothetical protein [Streptomyces]|jgi:hypothetical protein|uniref:hypothetical protein n=1 Tax=Streptomyces TaxID=1883 RepID=UPI001EFC1A62|nr:hypothetical protein [Streptomyces sp. CL12-4]MCG8968603.1 hypothetical protein [Streptomyces sp. CL12-4]
MNLVPQVETAELSDTDLDQVSGGHVGLDAGAAVFTTGGGVAAGLYAETGPVSVCAGLGASVGHGQARPMSI